MSPPPPIPLSPSIVWYQQAVKNSGGEKSWQTLLLYFVTGAIPVLLGFYTIAGIVIGRNIPIIPDKPDLIAKAVPFFFASIFFELAYSKLRKRPYYRLNDGLSSVWMGMMQVKFGVFFGWMETMPYAWLRERTQIAQFSEEVTSSVWFWLLTWIGIDFGYYWFHRFAHEWNPFWAAHVVHHNSEEYNLTTALRQSMLQGWFSWAFYLPLAPVVPLPQYVLFSKINTLYQFLIHTRTIDKMPKWFEYIFNTPSHHRVHHGRNAKYIDKNYGGTFIIFDRIFGTFEGEEEEVDYGITHSLGTWNVFYIQFHQWEEIIQSCKRTPGLWNKIRVWLDRGPGYNYFLLQNKDDLGNSKQPPIIKREKYDCNPIHSSLKAYISIHSVLLIIFTDFILGKSRVIYQHHTLVYTLYIYLTLFSMSCLFDRRWFAPLIETARLILTQIGWKWMNIEEGKSAVEKELKKLIDTNIGEARAESIIMMVTLCSFIFILFIYLRASTLKPKVK